MENGKVFKQYFVLDVSDTGKLSVSSGSNVQHGKRSDSVAVGTPITGRPPHRTGRAALRIRLPPRVVDGEEFVGSRMADTKSWEKVSDQLRHPFP